MTEEAAAASGAEFRVSFEAREVVTVGWYSPKEIVHVFWQSPASSSELRAAVEAGIVTLAENRGTRWCADCRALGPISVEDQAWLDRDWFPRAFAAGLERMAIVLPYEVLAKTAVEDIVERVPATQMERAYFKTVWEAGRWLAPPPTETGPPALGRERSSASPQ
jgi:hypothetical protein